MGHGFPGFRHILTRKLVFLYGLSGLSMVHPSIYPGNSKSSRRGVGMASIFMASRFRCFRCPLGDGLEFNMFTTLYIYNNNLCN